MKFKRDRYSKLTKNNSIELTEYLSIQLNGSDYGLGQLESVQSSHSKLEQAFINLTKTLVDKNILNKNDILMIVHGYLPENEKE